MQADPAGFPTALGPAQRGRATPAARSSSEVQRVCRGRISSGWVAIDYEESDECPAAAERFNGALQVNYGKLPRDSELLVCSDQRIPAGWTRADLAPNAEVEGQCRSSVPANQGSARVMMIRRVH